MRIFATWCAQMAKALAVDDFPALMREWSEWAKCLIGVGYSDSTSIWRALMANAAGEFKSRPPSGLQVLETHGALTRLINAMDVLDEDVDARPHLYCLRAVYLIGMEEAVTHIGKSKGKIYESCRTAESLLRVEMKRH